MPTWATGSLMRFIGLIGLGACLAMPAQAAAPLVDIPAGEYRPLLPGKDDAKLQPVAGFRLEKHAVTNGDFEAFLKENPKWRRGRVISLFANENYLNHFKTDARAPRAARRAPVVNVSFFAATAFCKWRGRRLPSTAEWEYVGAASATAPNGRDDPAYNQAILNWYAKPNHGEISVVAQTPPNYFGVQDMHGLIWEWTGDFNSVLVTGESREDASLDRGLFCGSGSIGAADPSDYAAFMRTAFRSSLDGKYAGRGLGFRCATDAKQKRRRK